VASFFLSRIDVLVDELLEKKGKAGSAKRVTAAALKGQVAIACARKAYEIYQDIYDTEVFLDMAKEGARSQRLLWASTSTKNPAYEDLKYVEPLIGPETINTMPQETLNAYRDHGTPADRLRLEKELTDKVLVDLLDLGIDLDKVSQQLEDEGVDKFIQPFDKLMTVLEQRRGKAFS
jgi:transaldolase